MGKLTPEMEEKIRAAYATDPSYKRVADKFGIDERTVKRIVREGPLKPTGGKGAANDKTKAYKLFKEGKSIYEVAVTLNLRQPEVEQLKSEYLRLIRYDELDRIYHTLPREHLHRFLLLYRKMSQKNIDPIDYMPLLNQIKELANVNQDLATTRQELMTDKEEREVLTQELKGLTSKISSAKSQLGPLSEELNEKRLEREYLTDQVQRLYKDIEKVRSFLEQLPTREAFITLASAVNKSINEYVDNYENQLHLMVELVCEFIRQDPFKIDLIHGPDPRMTESQKMEFRAVQSKHMSQLAIQIISLIKKRAANDVLQTAISKRLNFAPTAILAEYSRTNNPDKVIGLIEEIDEFYQSMKLQPTITRKKMANQTQ